MNHPFSLTAVSTVTNRLKDANIHYASGGSGLLYSLGLTEQVRDWDITTDAPIEAVVNALQGIHWTQALSGDYPFASSYRISILHNTLPIDLIGSFAIYSEAGLCRLPSHSAAVWEQIPMGSPEIWAVAYSLMNRQDKAFKLFAYLQAHGANHERIHQLLQEPLPKPLQSKLLTLLPSSE
ncbi:hypothetical protein [Paenibacillus sp. RC67]|uniref:hypothetical protein n=1 Tax=Paenibacillus sp. RC67 TaxID=3039392 RepID=UPI0024ADE075|nr:hypothetical protein [Paenibacillus sp. RC67]